MERSLAPCPLPLAPTRSQVLHLLVHDLTSLRPLLYAWVGVLAAQAAVLWLGPPVPDGAVGPSMSLDVAAFVLRLALTVVFVAAIVGRHPVTGTTAFWRTRPVRRGDVLFATLLGLFLVTVWLPAMALGMMFVALGLGPGAAADAALRVGAEQALVAALAFTLAALTRNLAQAIVVGLSAAAVFTSGVYWARALPGGHFPFALELRQNEWTAIWAQVAGAVLLFLPAAHQYLTMKTRTSYALAIVLLAMAVLATRNPFLRWIPFQIPAADVALDVPAVGFDHSSIRTGNASRSAPGERTITVVTQSALFEPAGPGGAMVLRPMFVQSRLRFRDGHSVDFDSRTGVAWVDGGPESRAGTQPWASMGAALGGAHVVTPATANDERFRATFMQVPNDAFATQANQPARLMMNVTSEAYRHDVFARVPLAEGGRARAEGYVLRYEGMSSEARALWVNIYELSVARWYEPRPNAYLLVNARRRQAVVASDRLTERFRTALTAAGTPIMARHQVEFELDPGSVVIDADWLRDAEFVVLRAHSLGRVIRGLVVDPFTLAPPHVRAIEGARDKGIQGASEGARDKGQGARGEPRTATERLP